MSKLNGVLIIDDNETSNFLNHRLLKRLDVSERIQAFNNANHAMEFLQKVALQDYDAADSSYFKPDLILLDVNMPDLNGFEFLDLFRNFPPEFKEEIVISMLSTSNHPQDVNRAGTYGVGYMFKPLTPEKITDLLNKIM